MMRREQIEALGTVLGKQEVNDLLELHDAHTRLTEPYRGPSGNDVLAPGPPLSPQRMLDDIARTLGWRTDFSCGSPITWDLVLDGIRRLRSSKRDLPASASLLAVSLVPPCVLLKVRDLPHYLRELSRHDSMSDDDLLHATEVCLLHLERLDDERGADFHLRTVLVPELWERIRPGTRDPLRRRTTPLAEYREIPLSFFTRSRPVESSRPRHCLPAEILRRRVAATTALDVLALAEQVRRELEGSRVADRWEPDQHVYEPGFTYQVVPVIAWRALERARRASPEATAP